ncbi:MAG: tRNA-dihydrouridine synthase [Nanoarchaeota archaeon]|nr:tRNA-dihydrouridine synthase [Nanoarchaeota archaeon]
MEIHLASMENVSCWAFRRLMQGITDSYTGILSMNYLIKRTKAWKEIDTFKIKGQRQWIQLSTSKEKECSDFLKRIDKQLELEPEKDNVYGLQLNLSCPSPNIISIGQGPALIKRPQKVASLINELLKQNKFKVSLKTRLGLNETEVKERRIIKLFEELKKIKNTNFIGVVVHFKHAKQPSFAEPDYSMLKELCSFNIPIVINGGIKSYEDFNNIIKELSPDERKSIKGLMIGREALSNPDCFVEISNILKKIDNSIIKKRSMEEINSEFKKLCEEHMPKEIYLKKINQLCGWNK